MNTRAIVCSLLTSLFLVLTSGCAKEEAAAIKPGSPQLKIFAPAPEVVTSESNPITEAKVALGRMLYYEKRISRGQDVSCNTCHLLDNYGVDNEPTSEGHKGLRGDRNSPTVYNAAGHFVQFWDGRAPDVEEQAKGPVLNPVEMAMRTEKHVVAVLKSMPGYVEAFKAAFPEDKDPITYENFAKAIGAFERKLITRSRWDKFLAGDANALTKEEKAGLNEFLKANCQTCHMGTYLGATTFQKLGLVRSWPDATDPGREKHTGSQADRMMFKVPSLRNVEKTGPYFHNGSIATLQEAVAAMGEYQLGKELTATQRDAIVTFLNALTGELPMDYIKEPKLPESTAKTPKPDLSD
ncbi:MAG: cytochrome-c peroxidase [Bryobacteraceae bacterium]|nr:cytochrome-c peroxidase [Bryobacteraceae bacterium]